MDNKKSELTLNKLFQRERELLNAMIPNEEDPGDIAAQFSSLHLKEEESNLVVYGPLNESFYVVNCPFVWSEYISNDNVEVFMSHMEEESMAHVWEWKTFCFQLYLAFLNGRMGKLSDAFKQLKICEEVLSKNSDDEFYQEIKSGLNHGLQASKAHLHFLKGDADLADEIISSVTPLKDLDKPSKAALIALNAEVLQAFDATYKKMALELMQTVVKLDPDDDGSRRGAWYYIVGKLLGQLRRMEHRAGMPSQEELQMLERARKINPFPVCLATLADSYREACFSALCSDRIQLGSEIRSQMLREAKQLYKQACDMDDLTYSTLRRCGNGLMKLPPPYKDLTLSKQCLLKAIALHPKCSSAYQTLGTMEEKYFKNPTAALKYFELSYENGNPISASFIVQVRRKIERNYNPLNDLDKFMKDLDEERHDMKAEFLVLKGEYLFFCQKDLLAAGKVWKEAISIAPDSENILNHACRFVDGRYIEKPYMKKLGRNCSFNLYKCLDYEIKYLNKTFRYPDEDIEFLMELRNLCVTKSGE